MDKNVQITGEMLEKFLEEIKNENYKDAKLILQSYRKMLEQIKEHSFIREVETKELTIQLKAYREEYSNLQSTISNYLKIRGYKEVNALTLIMEDINLIQHSLGFLSGEKLY